MYDGVSSLTRVGKCPVCNARVETSHTDIFFPYCGYKCKRVIQRKEEEKEKLKIQEQQRKQEERIAAMKMREEKAKAKTEKEITILQVRERLSECQRKYDQYAKTAATLPKGSRLKHRKTERAKHWYRQMIETQKQLSVMEKESEI